MRVLITGGAGFIGKKLARRLLDRGRLLDQSIQNITLFDVATADGLAPDPRLRSLAGDIADGTAMRDLLADDFTVIYHLAAVVSAAAEADFDLGMRVNLDGTRNLLEAVRARASTLRLVFASSCAVYGGDLPAVVTDETPLTPQSSYGAQKAACELLVNDCGRKGFVDSRSLRLPTIVVRPGRPNKAASTFASSIVREPLNGETAVCPVSRDTQMYVLSPRKVVDALLHATELPASSFGMNRSLILPGITMAVEEMVKALESVGGRGVVERIRFEPDPTIQKIVMGWPARFAANRARQLGFQADSDLVSIIRQHVEDELGGRIA